MSYFVSRREKRLWIWALVVIMAIFATLGLAQRLAPYVNDNAIAGVWLFLAGCLLVLLAVITSGLKVRPKGKELFVALGITAAYLLVFVRMAIPTERSHLIEYGVLALFIYEALKERRANGGNVSAPAVLAISIATIVGILDEFVQHVIPGRVMDPEDMIFNFLAAVMAVCSSVALTRTQGRRS